LKGKGKVFLQYFLSRDRHAFNLCDFDECITHVYACRVIRIHPHIPNRIRSPSGIAHLTRPRFNDSSTPQDPIFIRRYPRAGPDPSDVSVCPPSHDPNPATLFLMPPRLRNRLTWISGATLTAHPFYHLRMMSQASSSALQKICATCGRQITWRKRWEVRYFPLIVWPNCDVLSVWHKVWLAPTSVSPWFEPWWCSETFSPLRRFASRAELAQRRCLPQRHFPSLYLLFVFAFCNFNFIPSLCCDSVRVEYLNIIVAPHLKYWDGVKIEVLIALAMLEVVLGTPIGKVTSEVSCLITLFSNKRKAGRTKLHSIFSVISSFINNFWQMSISLVSCVSP
jgi:hypothetical protein